MALDDGLMQNRLLRALRPQARDFLYPRMLTKPIAAGEVIFEPDSQLIHLVFPQSGLISVQATLQDGRVVEKISIGIDGFIGLNYLFGETRSTSRAVAIVAGSGSWISVADFKEGVAKFECVRDVMLGYSMQTIRRLMGTVVCASSHHAVQRIATWLLQAHDRCAVDGFDLTQRAVANIFGFRLATVGEAFARLGSVGRDRPFARNDHDLEPGNPRIPGVRMLSIDAL